MLVGIFMYGKSVIFVSQVSVEFLEISLLWFYSFCYLEFTDLILIEDLFERLKLHKCAISWIKLMQLKLWD